MKYKAVIFDLDGTLVNSIFDIADAMNIVLAKRNYQTFDYNTYKTFIGHGVLSLIEKAVPQTDNNAHVLQACFKDMMSTYSTICTLKTKMYAGILELLEELNHNNIILSVLSNKEDTLTKKVAAKILPSYVQPVIGLTHEHLKKPNPKVLLHLCKTINIEPSDCIYVGDTNVDILVAKNANMHSVGVSWGFRDKADLRKAGADFIINTPQDLLSILK